MKRLTGFFNMKKLVLGALACAALVLMMPGEAKAAEHVQNTFLSFTPYLETVDKLESDGYKWENGNGSTWNKLTLKDIKIDIPDDSSNGKAIAVQGNTEIVLEGENEIELTNSSSDGMGGIYIFGDLKITGNGK